MTEPQGLKTKWDTVEFRQYGHARKAFSEEEWGWDVHRNKGGSFIGGIAWCEEWGLSVVSTVLSQSEIHEIDEFMAQLVGKG